MDTVFSRSPLSGLLVFGLDLSTNANLHCKSKYNYLAKLKTHTANFSNKNLEERFTWARRFRHYSLWIIEYRLAINTSNAPARITHCFFGRKCMMRCRLGVHKLRIIRNQCGRQL